MYGYPIPAQMAGVGKDREILLKSPIENAQSRAPWIFASLIGGICAAAIIGYFDYLIKEMIVLASFIPVIISRRVDSALERCKRT